MTNFRGHDPANYPALMFHSEFQTESSRRGAVYILIPDICELKNGWYRLDAPYARFFGFISDRQKFSLQ